MNETSDSPYRLHYVLIGDIFRLSFHRGCSIGLVLVSDDHHNSQYLTISSVLVVIDLVYSAFCIPILTPYTLLQNPKG